jgi:hypothetical protein
MTIFGVPVIVDAFTLFWGGFGLAAAILVIRLACTTECKTGGGCRKFCHRGFGG